RCATPRALDLFESESLAISGRQFDLTGNVTAGFNTGDPVWRGCRMAGGHCVSSDERQSCKYKLAFLVCLGVVFRVHVRPEDVDLCVSEGNLLTICLLQPNVTAQFANLCDCGKGSGCNQNGYR